MDIAVIKEFDNMEIEDKLETMQGLIQMELMQNDNIINRTVAVNIANLIAFLAYSSEVSYEGSALLIKAMDGAINEFDGWEKYMQGEFLDAAVAGDHNSMLEERYVDSLVEKIKSVI